MGLFDQVGNVWKTLDRAGEGARQQLFGLITGRDGGLQGLMDKFRAKGLGGVMQSWISTGPNEPIAPGQVEEVLGPDKIAEIADKLGVPRDQVKSKLAELLPQAVDQMTPNGRLDEPAPTNPPGSAQRPPA